jgi:23S rRNA (uracil-5-)-methyltransferase RumA
LTVTALTDSGRGLAILRGTVPGNDRTRTWRFEAHGAHVGDVIEVETASSRKGELNGRVVNVIERAPTHVEPRCQHAGPRTEKVGSGCGGCTLQTLEYGEQLEFKAARVGRLMTAAGIETPVNPALGMDSPWRYRNKMELTFGNDDGIQIGLHPVGWKFDIFDQQECYLMHESMMTIVDATRAFFRTTELRAWNPRRAEGDLRTLTIRRAFDPQSWMVELTSAPLADDAIPLVEQWSEALRSAWTTTAGDPPLGIFHTVHDAQRGRRTEIRVQHLSGPATLNETLTLRTGQRLVFDVQPRSFFQPNPIQAQTLYSLVVEACEASTVEAPRVLDLFCGTGTIGIALAAGASEVVGIDIVKDAIDDAHANALRNGVSNTQFLAGDAAEVLGAMDDRAFDIVVVDPPRAGLGAKACELIASIAPRLLIYVSCNPQTQAADLAMLRELAGVEVDSLQPVDMFPHTGHVECVARVRFPDAR